MTRLSHKVFVVQMRLTDTTVLKNASTYRQLTCAASESNFSIFEKCCLWSLWVEQFQDLDLQQ